MRCWYLWLNASSVIIILIVKTLLRLYITAVQGQEYSNNVVKLGVTRLNILQIITCNKAWRSYLSMTCFVSCIKHPENSLSYINTFSLSFSACEMKIKLVFQCATEWILYSLWILQAAYTTQTFSWWRHNCLLSLTIFASHLEKHELGLLHTAPRSLKSSLSPAQKQICGKVCYVHTNLKYGLQIFLSTCTYSIHAAKRHKTRTLAKVPDIQPSVL